MGVAALLGAAGAAAHPDPRATLEALDVALAESPSGSASLARAAARREAGDLEGAARDLAEAEASFAVTRAEVALAGARLAAARGDDPRAEALFGDVLTAARPPAATAPSGLLATALTERARLRERRRNVEGARNDWDAAFAARPNADAAAARGALDEAEGQLTRAAAGYREGLASTGAVALRRALARVELARGAWTAAEQLANEALSAPGAEVEWLLVRAAARKGAGQAEAAEADRRLALATAQRALRQRPSGLRLVALGRALLANGQVEEARATLDDVLRAHPTLPEARALAEEARAPRPRSPNTSPEDER
jgi:tetratricopeptide (TPR) repeat protein